MFTFNTRCAGARPWMCGAPFMTRTLVAFRPARLREGRTLPLLQYVVTLAVVEAIQDMAHDALASLPPPAVSAASAQQEAPPPGTRPRLLDVRIKWPNDIYAGGLKARSPGHTWHALHVPWHGHVGLTVPCSAPILVLPR